MRLFIAVIVLWCIVGHTGSSSFKGRVSYKGCFNPVTLQRQSGHLLNPFRADSCFKLCFGKGHTHAGLQHTNSTCYCGDIMDQMRTAEDHECNHCGEDSSFYCGGISQVSLYRIYSVEAVNITNSIDYEETKSKFGEEPIIIVAVNGPTGSEVFMYNISSQELTTVVKSEWSVDSIDYDLRRNEMFVVLEESLYRIPLFAEEPLTIEAHDEPIAHLGRCPTFAVDWVHGVIFFPECYSHTINIRNLNSPNYHDETTLVKPPEGAWALDMVVDPYKGLLFWSTGPTLMSCRLDGSGLRKVVPEFPVNKVSSIALDLAAERVYFSGTDKHDKNTSRLYYTTYSGKVSHSLQFHEYEGGSHIMSFGLFNYHLYFIENNHDNTSIVVSTKLENIHRPTVYPIKIEGFEPSHLRLVHPQLQTPAKEDTCTNKGCSHLCVIENSLPRCLCPPYYVLEHDNNTCLLNPGYEEEYLVYKIVWGLILVLFVLLGAGVLMCLCDKIWSQLHPTMVRLSVPGAAKVSFTGQRRPDSENLI